MLGSLDPGPGDEIVLARHGYGAVRIAAQHWVARRGIVVVEAVFPVGASDPGDRRGLCRGVRPAHAFGGDRCDHVADRRGPAGGGRRRRGGRPGAGRRGPRPRHVAHRYRRAGRRLLGRQPTQVGIHAARVGGALGGSGASGVDSALGAQLAAAAGLPCELRLSGHLGLFGVAGDRRWPGLLAADRWLAASCGADRLGGGRAVDRRRGPGHRNGRTADARTDNATRQAAGRVSRRRQRTPMPSTRSSPPDTGSRWRPCRSTVPATCGSQPPRTP